MDRGARRPTVHRVAKSWTRLRQLSMHAHMKSRKMVPMNLFAGQQWRHKYREKTEGPGRGEEGESGTDGESRMETDTLPYIK